MSNPSGLPINASTRYCAVFGQPVRHSASPAMQNAGIAALGLNWGYLAFEVAPEQLGPAIQGAQSMHFVGLNLTVPHKLLAYELVDELDESARTWGAVNTIRFEGRDGEKWRPLAELEKTPAETRSHGFNTDADAIIRAVREDLGLEVTDKKVLLLGAGGAGRTAALRLAAEGVGELFLVNRTQSKAEAVAMEVQKFYPKVAVKLGYPRGEVDLLMNATSLGLRETDGLPFDQEAFSIEQSRAVFDMIYRPARTPLLARAAAKGCSTANGLGMLLYQGAKALELWSALPAPLAAMRRALEQNVYGTL